MLGIEEIKSVPHAPVSHPFIERLIGTVRREYLRDAPVAEIEAAIHAATWPEQKAPRIKAILQTITELRDGSLSLEFLAELSPSEARHWLKKLQGVGPKTSAAVLLFSRLRIPALPVDCHHQRVAERLGLIRPRLPSSKMHDILAAQLPENFSAQEVYDNHEVLMLHGQRCCTIRNPACHRCPVLSFCPEGLKRYSREDFKEDSAQDLDMQETGVST